MRISDWSSDVCSSDLVETAPGIAGVGDHPLQRNILDPARHFMRADEQAKLLDAFIELTHQVAAAGAEPSRRSISARIGRISSAAALAPPPLPLQKIGRAAGRERGCPYG